MRCGRRCAWSLLEQPSVDGAQWHGVDNQLLTFGGDEHDESDKVGGAVPSDDEPPVRVLAEVVDDHGVFDGGEDVIVGNAVAAGSRMDLDTALLYYEKKNWAGSRAYHEGRAERPAPCAPGPRLAVIAMAPVGGDVGRPDFTGCWCCGGRTVRASLLRLGEHPEVGVCFRCVGWLARRKHEIERRTPAAPVGWPLWRRVRFSLGFNRC